MRRLALACCLLAGAAVAAPVPKSKDGSGFQRPEWGRPIDPDGKCKFTFGDGPVAIEAPAGTFWLRPDPRPEARGETNAPRLLRAAKGDFRATVRVRGDFRPKPLPSGAAGSAAAALVVLDKDDPSRAFTLEAGASDGGVRDFSLRIRAISSAPRGFANYGGFRSAFHRAVKGAGGEELWELHLGVERRGDRLTPLASKDGVKWQSATPPGTVGLSKKELDRQDRAKRFKGEVKVGVAVTNDSASGVKVTFDRFKLTRLKDEPKD